MPIQNDPPPASQSADPPKNSLTWPRALAIALFIFGAPALYRQQSLVRLPFDEAPVERMHQLRPDCVLLGDSMLRSRIDEKLLDQISGLRCAVFSYPGSGTSLWYLFAKNVVARQTPPPRWMIVLFRDKQLTMAAYRAGNRYRDGLERCMRGDEPQFDAILGRVWQDVEPWPQRISAAVYLMQRKRRDWQEKVQFAAMKIVAEHSERGAVRDAAAWIFRPRYTRAQEDIVDARNGELNLDEEAHDFQANVGQSFLPAILDIAQRSHVRLIFYRVKRHPKTPTSPSVDKPYLQKYAGELRDYLTARGAFLVDETSDPEVTFDYYSGDDHVRDEMVAPYTGLFWKRISPLMKQGNLSAGPAMP